MRKVLDEYCTNDLIANYFENNSLREYIAFKLKVFNDN